MFDLSEDFLAGAESDSSIEERTGGKSRARGAGLGLILNSAGLEWIVPSFIEHGCIKVSQLLNLDLDSRLSLYHDIGLTESDVGKIEAALLEADPACIPVASWDHAQCLQWLSSLPTECAVDISRIREPTLTGADLIASLDSTRELRDTFGLTTPSARVAFERQLRRQLASSRQPSSGATGGMYSQSFLRAVQPLYDLHMGVENMGPLLYSLIRFLKPRQVVEIGAGYTTPFMLLALRDNEREMEHHRRLQIAGQNRCGNVPWSVGHEVQSRAKSGVLHCIDNMAHEHTTAHLVVETAAQLGLENQLALHVQDATEFLETHLADKTRDPFDFLWVDVGAGPQMEAVFQRCLEGVSGQGGFILVHSTLTNTVMRNWLDPIREGAKPVRDSFTLHSLSLLEPHKRFQNSVSLFQKRSAGFKEPIHSKYP